MMITTRFFQVPVVKKVDNVIHGINFYPVDSAIGFPNTSPLDHDRDLSADSAIHSLNTVPV